MTDTTPTQGEPSAGRPSGSSGSGGGRSRSANNRSRRGGGSKSGGGAGANAAGSGPRSGGGNSGGSRSQGQGRGGQSGGGRSGGSRSGGSRQSGRSSSGGSGGGGRGPGRDQHRRPTRADSEPIPIPVLPVDPAAGTVVTEAEIRANRHRASAICWLLSAIPSLVVGIVLGIAISPIAGVVALVVLTVVVALVAKRRATAAALRSVGAIDADPDRFPRLSNMVDGLCATLGLRPPRLMVVSDPVPNACAFGTTPDDAALVVTTGLLDTVDVLELEGVVAHELAHIKRHDSTVASIVVSMLGPFARMAGGDSLVHAALGHGREYRADQLASAAVRYPAGLHDALAALAAGPPPVAGSVFEARRLAASRWVWIDPMVGRRNVVPADGELDATSVRVAALGEW